MAYPSWTLASHRALLVAIIGLSSACALPRSGLDSDASTRTDAAADATRPVDCVTASDCPDDSIGCTTTRCEAGLCQNRPDDSMCSDGPDGRCDPILGCQYATCNAAECVAGPCETARCVGTSCVREPACGDFEMCCGDSCVPLGCNDGDACTNDACGAAGCEHVPNAAPCDDGVFCNGADTCTAGECSVHPGDPCSGTTVCDEAAVVCVGCVSDADCPADTVGAYDACGGFTELCDERGDQDRMVTEFTCMGDVCRGTTRTETRACSRDQGGTMCGATTEAPYDACGDYGSTCGESGTQSRDVTERRCGAGTCNELVRSESRGCNRDTDADSCGTTSFGDWSTCTDFLSACDESGSQSRTATDRLCTAGTCGDVPRALNRGCVRDTEGTSCGAAVCGSFGSCDYTGSCDESANRSRSCDEPTCSSGACGIVTVTDDMACSRDTDGDGCDPGPVCDDWSACAGFLDVCDMTGTHQRACTIPTCTVGACGVEAVIEMESCARASTDTDSCDDGNTCTVGDACSAGACVPGVVCPANPSRPCGIQTCEAGACVENNECSGCAGSSCDPVSCSCD